MTDDRDAELLALRDVMQQIMQVLGPTSVCQCRGCAWETDEALRLLRAAGFEYQGRRGPRAVPHEPAKERLGNEIALADPLRAIRDAKYLNPVCAEHGCQALVIARAGNAKKRDA